MKKLITLLLLFILIKTAMGQNNLYLDNNYECLTETRVSGLFQSKRKFLKETEFFPSKTTFNFSKNHSLLTEMESNKEKKYEAKYQFQCNKKKKLELINCEPTDNNNTYSIVLSLDTLRYRKILITDYWLDGIGKEVDYLHLAHGYCYSID
ncbi:MAG: hypothetical protein CBE14_001115 [Rickettsiales bacterium TMED254]|nr:hypothetical protein [Rickettsiales bacterium]RPF77323.1 MAG: hypothetical protein CBE14_001115 [Rickettsiales bacterium TMED254]